MSRSQQPSTSGAFILLGVGILCLIGGYFLATEYANLAALFWGAKFDIGSPVSDADRMKALFFEGAGILAIGQGAILFVVGLFVLGRSAAAQRTAAKPIEG